MGTDAVERAGLRYPPGKPDDFTAASHRLARVSADLQHGEVVGIGYAPAEPDRADLASPAAHGTCS